jgi:predicted nucleotidyltransferase
MPTLSRDFRELLELLNSGGVRYLVLGGYAVNFHGHHRNTKDLDLWIAVDPNNAGRVSESLRQFGFPAASVPPSLFLQKGKVFVLGREPFRVDLLTNPSGVDFEPCYARRVETVLDGVAVPFIALDDLIINKRASGRLRDRADVEELARPKPQHRPTKRRRGGRRK